MFIGKGSGFCAEGIRDFRDEVSGPWYVADMESVDNRAQPSMYRTCNPADMGTAELQRSVATSCA